MTKKELFYAELCWICNELKVVGQECLGCKLDSVMDTYHTRIIADNKKIGEMSDKLKAQGKLLSSGVVISTEEYSELLSSKEKLEAENKILKGITETFENALQLRENGVISYGDYYEITKAKIKEMRDE